MDLDLNIGYTELLKPIELKKIDISILNEKLTENIKLCDILYKESIELFDVFRVENREKLDKVFFCIIVIWQ